MKRWVVAAVLAALSVVGMPTLAASADEAECAGNRYVGSGYEYFDLDPDWLPPSLRSSGWDCALKVENRDFDLTLLDDGRYATALNFILYYVDMDFDELVAFFREFEQSTYMGPNDINIIGTPDGGTQSAALGSDDLLALDPQPGYVNARFSHPQEVEPPGSPNSNIYALTWTDGVQYQSETGIEGRPQLVANIIVTVPFVTGTGIDDPSTLSDLQPIYAPTGVQWGVIAGGSVMLMLVVGWPSTLLNSVVGSRYQSIVRAVTTRFRSKPEGSDAASAPPSEAAPVGPVLCGNPGFPAG